MQEFIDHRVEFYINSGMNQDITDKLVKSRLLSEDRKKVYLYESQIDGAHDWEVVKKRRLNVFGSTGPGLSEDSLQ